MYEMYIKPYAWKWVCVQHPMILISDDRSNPRALETVPPWGANDIPGYCHKMFEMLEKLEANPQIKVDFDLSAKELLIFFENEPKGKALLKKLIKAGQVGFTGVDYAQAHYATARSESALRGIRMGAEVYKRELDIVSDTFQHQEIGIFQNLPQLLKAYGVRKGATFRFPTAMEFTDGAPELLYHFGELCFMRTSSMACWRGLDGTEIPMYLPWLQNNLDTDFEAFRVIHDHMRPEFQQGYKPFSTPKLAYPTFVEENKGMCRGGSIIMQCPDMVEINDDYIASRERVGTFWRLSEAIDEELKHTAEMPHMRYTSYWSYAEGRFGERMYKTYRKCEEAILAAEAMQVISAGLAGDFASEEAWDKLLTAQHHDVNWMDQKELCARAESWALQAKKAAEDYQQSVAAALTQGGEDGQSVMVFNTLPIAREGIVSLATDGAYRVFDGEEELPTQLDEGKLLFKAKASGLGYHSYRIEKASVATPVRTACSDGYHFENEVLTVDVLPDGRISSLCSKASGERLDGCGNVLQGLLWRENGERVPISNVQTGHSMQVTEGKLFNKVVLEGTMEEIPYRMVIRLPHGTDPEIRIELDITFNQTSVGDMVHDETKLNLYWPLRQAEPEVWIDEPFGVTRAHVNRPLLASNFISAFENGKGLTYCHEGTPKVWVENNVLVNQLAWGGRMITNRMQCDWFGWNGTDIFDMRLDGTVHYEYAIRVEDGAQASDVAAAVSQRVTPMPAFLSNRTVQDRTLLAIRNPNWVTTAVEERKGEYVVRGYEAAGRITVRDMDAAWKLKERTDAAGKPVAGDIRAYEITELHFDK